MILDTGLDILSMDVDPPSLLLRPRPVSSMTRYTSRGYDPRAAESASACEGGIEK